MRETPEVHADDFADVDVGPRDRVDANWSIGDFFEITGEELDCYADGLADGRRAKWRGDEGGRAEDEAGAEGGDAETWLCGGVV